MKRPILTAAAAAAALLAPSLALADDISGTWRVETTVDGDALAINCNFAQKERSLGGTCARDGGGDRPGLLTGVVEGLSVRWAYDVAVEDRIVHFAYAGNVEGTTITGMVEVGGASAPFAAVKK